MIYDIIYNNMIYHINFNEILLLMISSWRQIINFIKIYYEKRQISIFLKNVKYIILCAIGAQTRFFATVNSSAM